MIFPKYVQIYKKEVTFKKATSQIIDDSPVRHRQLFRLHIQTDRSATCTSDFPIF